MTWSSKDEDEFIRLQKRRNDFLASREANLEKICEVFGAVELNKHEIQRLLMGNAGAFVGALLPYCEPDKNAAIV